MADELISVEDAILESIGEGDEQSTEQESTGQPQEQQNRGGPQDLKDASGNIVAAGGKERS